MTPLAIVETLQEPEDLQFCGLAGCERNTLQSLALQRREETLRHGIVVVVPGRPIDRSMSASSQLRLDASAVYWLPRSECDTTPRAARVWRAISSAACTTATVWRVLIAQPATLRLNTSSTVAKYTNPSRSAHT